ncbi:hypothetical protein FDECE_13143 [Fusarium decemcellulare]|nr:hypothetical protein FDECE_13143 [Fusarium decemcellulare]
MACGSSPSLVNRNGPGSAATSIAESILKPAEATGTKTKCIECGDYECCCIPCTILKGHGTSQWLGRVLFGRKDAGFLQFDTVELFTRVAMYISNARLKRES